MASFKRLGAGLLIWFCASAALGSDLAKEQRWADQIVDTLIDGEAEWLTAQSHEFLAIYTEASEGDGKRAVIVLHGIGVHPNWPQVVYPLRVELAELGWSTISLQMPILPNDAEPYEYEPLFDEVAPRIDAGIRFLRDKGAEEIALVEHSLGATMGSYYLASNPNSNAIKVFIGVGMGAGSGYLRMNITFSLERIKIPVLDLYGSDDLDRVVKTAARRAAAAKRARNGAYEQIKVDGADHFFEGEEKELVGIVNAWLLGVSQ